MGRGTGVSRGRGSLTAQVDDLQNDRLQIVVHVVCCNPQRRDAPGRCPFVTAPIARRSIFAIVGEAVDFDRQRSRDTIKIKHERLERVLPRMNLSSPYVDMPKRLTVVENLRVYGHLYGLADVRGRIRELAEELDLGALLRRKTGELSSAAGPSMV